MESGIGKVRKVLSVSELRSAGPVRQNKVTHLSLANTPPISSKLRCMGYLGSEDGPTEEGGRIKEGDINLTYT